MQPLAPSSPAELNFDSQDLQACVAMMQGGSKTFFAASRLLPPRVRTAAIALYAFCRVADDLVDEAVAGDTPLDALQNRLDAIYAGTPQDHVEDHALSLVVQQYKLPRHLLDALIEGFAWDAGGRTYDSIEDVHAYAARVAGSVGAMMSWIMGPQSMDTLARACELGVAMQLTNIARDIGEDAKNGRLYIPRAWFRDLGLDADRWLAAPQFDERIACFTRRLLERADVLYQRGEAGISSLPWDCRPAIQAARLVYAEIGKQLIRDGLNSVNQRTVVSKRRKLVLIARATAVVVNPPHSLPRSLAPLPAIAFLVDAVADAHGVAGAHGSWRVPQRSFDERVEWMVDLFGRLEKQQRVPRQIP
jgi:phytoene synthase